MTSSKTVNDGGDSHFVSHFLSDLCCSHLGCSQANGETSSALVSPSFSSAFSIMILYFHASVVLYVIILSAALDLVPPSTPKGVIAFWNIAPCCCFLSVTGMIVGVLLHCQRVCLNDLHAGLGELTFLQLSTTFHPHSVAGRSVGYFASGTGAAGLVGSFLWWEIRGLGVRIGVGLSSVLPFVIPLAYFLLLPRTDAFSSLVLPDIEDATPPLSEYTQLPVSEEDAGEPWQLVKPMLPRYMAPLCVAPTLIYPVPAPESSPIFGHIIHSIRDYYPLWQLVYQSTVFLSRSSLSLGLPALPMRAISIPSVIQGILLITLSSESALGYFPESMATGLVFSLISVLCSYFYRATDEPAEEHERAFKMGAIGLADSLGILAASLAAMPTEVALCRAQVERGKLLCRQV
ncbi:CLN3 protein-domain-containing protein [Multifurca ochricompacta]|uniref:Protein BTN n=1 Tax=Multifurca ochricompacta TaxID=376703 RepID=A0AAD4QQN1_9AGAM|nr:CLN3 protein-domain-containing protein [Multifurca ochricompacta]